MEAAGFLRKVYYTSLALQRALNQKIEPAIFKTRNFHESRLYNSTKCFAAIDPPKIARHMPPFIS